MHLLKTKNNERSLKYGRIQLLTETGVQPVVLPRSVVSQRVTASMLPRSPSGNVALPQRLQLQQRDGPHQAALSQYRPQALPGLSSVSLRVPPPIADRLLSTADPALTSADHLLSAADSLITTAVRILTTAPQMISHCPQLIA